MQYLQKWKILLIIILVFTQLQSCNNDDGVAVKEEVAEATDDSDNTDNTTTDTDDADNNEDGDSDGDGEENSSGDGSITLYSVQGSSIVKQQDYEVNSEGAVLQNDISKHDEIWELAKKVFPADYISKLDQFRIIMEVNDNAIAAYVQPTLGNLTKWELAVNIEYAYLGGFNADGELTATLIHELAHIVCLNDSQIDPSIREEDCTRYFPGEGCSKEGAFLDKFNTAFWADIAEEHSALEGGAAQTEFYNTYNDRFVSAYASTNQVEDAAEVFRVFVTRDGGANGDAISEQKIEMMYDTPSFVALRDVIRNSIGIETKSNVNWPKESAWSRASTFGNPKRVHGVQPIK